MKEVNDVLMLAERLKHLVYARLTFIAIDIKVDDIIISTTFCLN